MNILITIDQSVQDYPHMDKYEEIITNVLQTVSITYGLQVTEEMSILLCDNAYIHALNKTYRGIDRPTDVLSFALNEGVSEENVDNPENILLGDIIISLDKVKEQAHEYGHSMERELAYLTVHGALHILGYDHMTDEEKAEMRTEEEYILEKLNYIREGQSYNE